LNNRIRRLFPIAAIILTAAGSLTLCSCGRSQPSPDPVAALTTQAGLVSNVTYLKFDSLELKLDLYQQTAMLGEDPWWRTSGKPKPVLLYIHGGGWIDGEKETRALGQLPYVSRGWILVNVDYRLSRQAKAPAAITDCRNALNWVYDNANKFEMDTNKIVVSGESAGGHLALMTGLLDNDTLFRDPQHPIGRKLRVAAIINWYGVTDFNTNFAEDLKDPKFHFWWVRPEDQSQEYLARLSPVSYIKPGIPPILSIHGDADPLVNVSQARELHAKLDQAGVPNALIVVKGRKHGGFTAAEQSDIFDRIWKFLEENRM
jgi:acetyl esterase/lipase